MNQEAITYGLRGTKHSEVPSNLNFLHAGAPPHTARALFYFFAAAPQTSSLCYCWIHSSYLVPYLISNLKDKR